MTDLSAGAACVPITPRIEDLRHGIYLGGFGSYRERRATGVHDEPMCRALALSDGSTTVVLAALDLVGASGPLLAAIRAESGRLTTLPASQILIACTHSHASPDMQGLWGGTSSSYEAHVTQCAARALSEAVQAMQPAIARVATTSLGGVVRNRRGWPETDETLTVLRLTSQSGAAIAALVNYACHPTASGRANTEISRDWCGYTVDAVERDLGGVAIYINGAIGDVDPMQDGGFDAARSVGDAVAARAIASLSSAEDVSGTIVAHVAPLELPINFERLSQRVQSAVGRAAPALSLLSKSGGLHKAAIILHKSGRGDLAQVVEALSGLSERTLIHREGVTYVPTHCACLRLGPLEAFAAPGEVLTRLALPLRAALGERHRMFLGLTQDTIGYFIPEDEWMTGRNNNYEESVSIGKHAGTILSQRLLSLIASGG